MYTLLMKKMNFLFMNMNILCEKLKKLNLKICYVNFLGVLDS